MSRFHAVFPEDRSDINMSPMLDVIFIMLIFFIVVASFIREDGLLIALPAAPGVDGHVAAITVRIESAGVFNINGRVMSGSSVAPYVRALHGENPQVPFAVMVADKVPIRDTVVAVDAGNGVGFSPVTVLPLEP